MTVTLTCPLSVPSSGVVSVIEPIRMKAGSPSVTSSDVTVSWAPTFTVSPLLLTDAVIVTSPAATPVAEHPVDVEVTVAIPVFDDAQVQLAASPATPPEALTAKTTLFPTATEAEAGAIVASTGGGGGGGSGVGWTISTSSPHAATPSARSPATRAKRLKIIINSPPVATITYHTDT